ncbi:hypothetical protein BGZ73_003863 [Actinomortierella ambigua]|nr:hypothetical protein BGZ73_003863 [Actinomortierella ambigua]
MAVQRSPCGKFVPVASWGRVVSKRSLNVVASIEISTKQPVAQPAQPAQVAGHAAPSPSLTVRLMQSPLAPQSAKLLSSLVASPKRISTTLARSTELPRVPLAVLQSSSVDKHTEDDKDDQGVSGPSSPSTGRLASRAMPSTPSGQKRELPEDFAATEGTPSSKKVWFGPTLSPEVFSKDEPPSTPVKRGAQTRAGTPRRAPTSTANLLERLKTASPAKSSLVSPRSLGRTVNFGELLQKPQPLKLLECNQGSTTDQPQHGRSQPSSSSHAHTEGNRSKIMTTQDNPFASSSPAPKPAQDKV